MSPTPNSAKDSADFSDLSYEEARAQLIEVVQALESGSQGLEESLATWERGEALARRCQEWLDGARERLAAAKAGPGEDGPGEDGPEHAGPDGRSGQ